MRFPVVRQLDAMDCGPACLKMVCKYYGKTFSLPYLRDRCFISRTGVSLLGISDAAESLGFRTLSAKVSAETLFEEAPLPAIVHWRQRHFVIVYKTTKKKVYVADPAHGLVTYSKKEFLEGWEVDPQGGVALFFEVTPEFYEVDDDRLKDNTGLRLLFRHLFNYKSFLTQLFLGLLLGSLLGLILPFLTQSLVDYGINKQNIGFVYTILAAQIMLFLSRTSVEFIRGWILLHLGTRINISILSVFLMKLMRLPLSFFDGKHLGDLLQRIGDHNRIENFLTSETLNTLFSMMNLVIFGAVLFYYSEEIFLVFLVGSVLSFVWIFIFLKKRAELDFKRFDQMSENQSNLVQLITGMPEIKLNNCAKQKRWEWQHIQAKLFKVSLKSLAINQYQQAGTGFLNEFKNIFISFLAAKEVINGEMTLGMMMAVTFIIGQLNSPITQLLGFIRSAQDAKLSLERLGEIHNQEDEEPEDIQKLTVLPARDRDLVVENLDFHYEGTISEKVLDNISVTIPYKKVTAIVGTSGSGKTTMVKLLLRFYQPSKGAIKLGDIDLQSYNADFWRQQCGVVMQDGHIFNETIAKNIALSDEVVDFEKLLNAARVANIHDFITSLPLHYNTKIGGDGHGLSQGQKQRILIARAVYKNPKYMFFDEATSALDANNEKIIMENMDQFFRERTAVVVAHRLSTVKNADQIIVLERGQLVEMGNHETLTAKRGYYFNLVKNQLELGS
ncbi:MAG: peptidase domain-containing ABC transporter [Acidobacteriota bacterium]|nr:peptidase domain-containing ABC transporter [Acidobacteriota bacterium]